MLTWQTRACHYRDKKITTRGRRAKRAVRLCPLLLLVATAVTGWILPGERPVGSGELRGARLVCKSCALK